MFSFSDLIPIKAAPIFRKKKGTNEPNINSSSSGNSSSNNNSSSNSSRKLVLYYEFVFIRTWFWWHAVLQLVIIDSTRRLLRQRWRWGHGTAPEVQTNFSSSQTFTMIVYFVIRTMTNDDYDSCFYFVSGYGVTEAGWEIRCLANVVTGGVDGVEKAHDTGIDNTRCTISWSFVPWSWNHDASSTVRAALYGWPNSLRSRRYNSPNDLSPMVFVF